MYKKYLLKLVFVFQICLLCASRIISLVIYARAQKSKSWVIGPTETAKTVFDMSMALPNSVTVNLNNHRFYGHGYTYSAKNRFYSYLFGPILLGFLSRQFCGFIYVGPNGFLIPNVDFRNFEFRMLRKWGCRIVSYQVGSDVRSIALLDEWGKNNQVETYATIARLAYSKEFLNQNEAIVKHRAEVIDLYSDLVFNSAVDQMSFIQSPILPTVYLVDDKYFESRTQKFGHMSKLVICHAPSNPVIKGTSEIRTAIDTLGKEGFAFEYLEFIDVPHSEVLEGLRRAHVVVNELFSMMPGVFAIEALAHECVLLTSADPRYEKDIKWDGSPAWIVTNRQNILQNLRWCLNNQESLEEIAKTGRSWAWENASRHAGSNWLVEKLNEIR